MEKKVLNVLFAEINARCWDDKMFKARFIAEPQRVFEEYDIPYNPNMEYRVLEASKDEAILVLPVKGAQEVLSKVAEAAQKVSDSTPILPDGRKLVIVQNTDKVTYLVISNIKEVSAGADMSGMPVDVLGGSVVSRTFLAVNVFVAAEAVALADAGMAVTAVTFAMAI